MPRIADDFLDCSLYLYPTLDDAKIGKRSGGSGFLVTVNGIIAGTPPDEAKEEPGYSSHFYAVSNRHVAEKNPIVRLNTHDGRFDVIPISHEDWTFTDYDDIAVAPVQFSQAYKFLSVNVVAFLSKETAASQDVGIGDEVFMVGRFIS